MNARARTVLLVVLSGLLLIHTAVVLVSLRDAAFHMDVWEMLRSGESWGTFFRTEWSQLVSSQVPRVRPVTHLVMVLYMRIAHDDGARLAMLLWFLALALAALQARFLLLAGLRRETALLTGFAMACGPALVGTTFAHQYNDLVLAAVFSFAAMNACLRDQPGPLWLVLPLAVLAIGSHETGVLCGPMLVLGQALRTGPGLWRRWLPRRDTLAILSLGALYAVFRVWRGGTGELTGAGSLAGNLRYVAGQLAQALGLVGMLAVIVLARLRVSRAALWRVPLGLFWAAGCYAPFLLNIRYQSVTYLCVAPLVPLALLLEPVVIALCSMTERGRLQGAAFVALAMLLWRAPPRPQGDRFAGPALRAILAHVDASSAPAEELWLVEDRTRPNPWGRSELEEELAVYDAMGSLALRTLRPSRPVAVHLADRREMGGVHPAPHALCLLLEGTHGAHRLWRLGATPSLLYGMAPAAPPDVACGAPPRASR